MSARRYLAVPPDGTCRVPQNAVPYLISREMRFLQHVMVRHSVRVHSCRFFHQYFWFRTSRAVGFIFGFKAPDGKSQLTTDFDVLFPVVHLSTHGGGGLVFGDGSDDPLQARLEAVMGQERPASSDFAIGFGERKKSAEVISGK
jgi:hypothetical protein